MFCAVTTAESRVDVKDGRIVDVRGDDENPITKGYLCNKGVTIDSYVRHEQRVEHPLRKRDDGTFEEIDWDTAISEISAKMGAIRNEHSPRSLALVGVGGQANHMDGAYALSFLRATGSRRWFNAYAQEKTQHNLVDYWLADAPPSVFLHADVQNTKFMLVLGTNPRISNRGHNATETFAALAADPTRTVVVADPRETETTRKAERHLRVRPGTDVYLLTAMAALIVQRELADMEFLAEHTQEFGQLRDVLSRVDVELMAEQCGIDSTTIEEVATQFAKSGASSIFYDLGVEQTPFSTLISYLIRVNLAITGNYAQPGGNVFLQTITPPEWSSNRHSEPERALMSGIPAIRALGNMAMFSPTLVPEEVLNDHPERIRGLIVEGSNPLLSFSDSQRWREACEKLDLLVVIDPAFSETARLADYVLPVPTGYEKWELALFPKGYPQVMTQVRPPVVPAPPDTLPEPEIYVRLAESMGLAEVPPAALRLAAAAGRWRVGRTLWLGLAAKMVGAATKRGFDAEAQLLVWAYRCLGPKLASPALTAVWLQCHLNAMKRKESVLRTLGQSWRGKSTPAIAEEIFARIMDHPEGVEIAQQDPAANFNAHVGYEDKQLRLAPQSMITELERALESSAPANEEYPFILGNGLRTRWTANTIQRDPAWRKGRGPHCTLSVNPDDAKSLGVTKGDLMSLETTRGKIVLPTTIDTKTPPGYVWMPNGFGMLYGENGATTVDGANMNEITDAADRDPFTGCPHHRIVHCRLALAADEEAAA